MYKYIVSYKDEQFLANSKEGLAKAIAKSKKIPLEEAMEEVKKLSKDFVTVKKENFESLVNKKKKPNLSDIVNGALALVNINISNTESQDEINRRAVICYNCPKLSKVTGCKMCGFAQSLTNTVNGIKKKFNKGFEIPNNLEDKYCGVCECALAVMLPATKEAYKNHNSSDRPKNCWVNELIN